MLSGQQMNLKVLLMWTSLRSTLSSFFKHMCMRFSTTTPTETSFFRAAFYFWKLWECLKMFLDVFGICQQDASGQRFFGMWWWIQTYWIHPTWWWEVWEESLFCACRRCHFNSTEQLKQEKTKLCMLHVQDNLAGQTACLFPLCFLCGKGTEGIAVKPSWIWVVFCSYARRGVKPTQFDASARY